MCVWGGEESEVTRLPKGTPWKMFQNIWAIFFGQGKAVT